MNNDYVIRATAANAQIRCFACTTKNLVETARMAHNTSPVMTAALGRLLSAGVMMGIMEKSESNQITLQIRGEGPGKGLTVTSDCRGNVRGYAVVPDAMLPPNSKGKLDVGGALAPGFLTVIKDMGLKDPYVGQTMLITGEIGDDLTEYYMSSEQIPSSVGLGVLMNKDNTVNVAGGFIIQLMPFTDDATIDKLESNLKEISGVTSMLAEGMKPEDMLKKVLDGFDVEVTKKMPARFRCNCSKDRFAKSLATLPKSDMKEMIDAGKEIETKCQFCGKHYSFSVDELKEIEKKR